MKNDSLWVKNGDVFFTKKRSVNSYRKSKNPRQIYPTKNSSQFRFLFEIGKRVSFWEKNFCWINSPGVFIQQNIFPKTASTSRFQTKIDTGNNFFVG